MKLALLLALSALVPAAGAEDPTCEGEALFVEPVGGLHTDLYVEQRDCEGARSYFIALRDPDGRTTVEWYDDDRGRGIEVFRPPRFVTWTDNERGCVLVVYTFGATELACPAGAPPEPVHVPL